MLGVIRIILLVIQIICLITQLTLAFMVSKQECPNDTIVDISQALTIANLILLCGQIICLTIAVAGR